MAAWIEMWPRRCWRDCAAEYQDGLREAGLGQSQMVAMALSLVTGAAWIRCRAWLLRPKWPQVAASSAVATAATAVLILAVQRSSAGTPVSVPAATVIALICAGVLTAMAGMILAVSLGLTLHAPSHAGAHGLILFLVPTPVIGITATLAHEHVMWHSPVTLTLATTTGFTCLLAMFVAGRFTWNVGMAKHAKHGRVEA